MSSSILETIESWRKDLLDISRRNRLINFKMGRTGGVAIAKPSADQLWRRLRANETVKFPWKRDLLPPSFSPPLSLPNPELPSDEELMGENEEQVSDRDANATLSACLDSPQLRPEHLLTRLTDKQLDAALKRLELRSREAETELGVNILFAGFGLLRWFESENSKEPNLSPLLLVPVRIRRDTIDSPWALSIEEDEVRRNDTLAQRLKSDFRIVMPELDEARESSEDESEFFGRYAKAVAERIQHHERWEVLTDEAALGTFHFQKLAMWEDLGRNSDRIASHPICRAIAGDRSALPAPPSGLPEAKELDNSPSQNAVHILDADSSQHAAIEAVKRGADLVLDGPPGTGKSQTIANLIAEFLAAGRTVLFVSEKMAALDVVKRRLDEKGLGDFCLGLHSHRANNRSVLSELGRCLELRSQSYRDPAEESRELDETRDRLNAYVKALHSPREPLKVKPYEAHSKLAKAKRLGLRTRCPVPDPAGTDASFLKRVTDILSRTPDCMDVLMNRDRHPWRGFRPESLSLDRQDELKYHIDRLAEQMPRAAKIAAALARIGLAPERPTHDAWLEAIEDAKRMLAVPQLPSKWFEDDPRTAAAAVIEIDVLTRRAREALARLPEFSRPALRAEGAAAIRELRGAPKPEAAGLSGLLKLGLRESIDRLRAAEDMVRASRKQAAAVGRALKDIEGYLKFNDLGRLHLNDAAMMIQVGQCVLKAGAVAEDWWDAANRQELLTAASQARDQMEEAGRQFLTLQQAFTPASLADPNSGPIADLPKPRFADADRMRMGEVRERLVRRRKQLGRLAEWAEASESAIRSLAERLGSPKAPEDLSAARAWAEGIKRAVGLAPVAPDHWGQDQRTKIRNALAESLRLQAEAEAASQGLEGRASAEALSGAFDQEIANAAAYRSWLRQWFPGWRSAKERLVSVFPNGLPSLPVLFADLERLRTRRRALVEIARLTESHGADWVRGADGRPDLEATEAILHRAAEAEALHSPTPQFREALAQPGSSLGASAEAIAAKAIEALAELQGVHNQLVEEAPILAHPAPAVGNAARFGELRSWAEEQAVAVEWQSKAADAARSAMVPEAFDRLTRGELESLHALRCERANRLEHVREIQRTYGERLGLNGPEEGTKVWASTAERLKCVDKLAKTKHPTLSRLMAPGGDLDRKGLETSTAALSQGFEQLKESWRSLNAAFEIPSEWDVPQAGLPRVKISDFDRVWAERAEALAQARECADRLVPLLRDQTDVLWSVAAKRFESLRELIGLRTQLDDLWSKAKVEASPEEAEARDWADETRLAGELSRFLDSWTRPIGPGVARGLSDPASRTEMRALIDQTEGVRSIASGFDESWSYLTEEIFDPRENISTGIVLAEAPLETLAQWVADRARDIPAARDWALYRELENDAEAAGVSTVLDEVRRGETQASEAADAYRSRFYRKWLDWVYEETPELRRFSMKEHERQIARFVELDRFLIQTAPERIRNVLLARDDRPQRFGDAHPESSELGLLARQLERKRGHLPLRKLFEKVPSVLLRLKPCLMMSPLAVSTYLQSRDFVFDLVIFDEASQVRPHDAISSIYRGKQLVVAGDQKQLPPTTFFDKDADDSDEETDDAERMRDYDSVLDICCSLGLTRRRLRWHYRSRREGLIAFSNQNYYENKLITFPSVRDAEGAAVRFEHAADGRYVQGVNVIEARKVAELVIRHFQQTPKESLGVIAFSQKQQLRILDELEALRKKHPELEVYFRPRSPSSDPFFVKNLENVQGDERDVMILSVGYGPDEAGKVAMRFGPLNREGGERRLNVAVTRARERITLVSSLRAGDIDLSRTSAEGARLLRVYLDYAETGIDALTRAVTEADRRGYDSPFEEEVAEGLRRRGLTVHRQVGCGGYRIDLAVVDPDQPGRYLLGVECDGATYHSSATARDRDRLREEVLSRLGWRLCRIWSTEWLRDPESQVQRVIEAVERARAQRGQPEPQPNTDAGAETLRDAPSSGTATTGPVPPPEPEPPPKLQTEKKYESIEEVPEAEIRRLLAEILTRAGASESKDLVQTVARRLGFKRTGSRIERRVSEMIDRMISDGRLTKSPSDGRIRAAAPSN